MAGRQSGTSPWARLRSHAWRLRPNNKVAFVMQLPENAALLDVGCGTPWAARVKQVRPDIRYVGLDIGDYCQEEHSKSLMDRYVLATPERFAEAISSIAERFDAVVSSHNIEHCNHPYDVIRAMCGALKPGGQLYFAFPAEASVRFPRREGTLNFADDPTHVFVPPWEKMKQALCDNGMRIERAIRRSRPIALFVAGLLYEPISMLTRKTDGPGATWALWGFESIIWAKREADPPVL